LVSPGRPFGRMVFDSAVSVSGCVGGMAVAGGLVAVGGIAVDKVSVVALMAV